MSMDLTGIYNQNEYYTNHYFSSIFEENAADTISVWRNEAKESEERTPWAMLRENAKQFYPVHDRYVRSRFDIQTLQNIQTLADCYLKSLGYPEAKPENIPVDDTVTAPVYLELTKLNGAPLLWVILSASPEKAGILESNALFSGFLFGGVSAIMYAAAGGLLSMITMTVLKKLNFSLIPVSMVGAAMHNVGQVSLAMLILETRNLVYYMAILAFIGLVCGALTGIVARSVISHSHKLHLSFKD